MTTDKGSKSAGNWTGGKFSTLATMKLIFGEKLAGFVFNPSVSLGCHQHQLVHFNLEVTKDTTKLIQLFYNQENLTCLPYTQ